MGGVSQVTPTPADPFAALGGQFESALPPPPPTPAKAGTLPGQPPPPRDPFAALGATFEGPPAAAQPAPAPPQAAPGSITEAGRTAYTKQFERGGPYAGGAMPPAPLVGRPDTAQRADSLVATLRAPAPPPVPPDVARLQQANQAVAQGLAQHAATQATVEAAPEQGYLARVGTELRNSALGHAIQTEFPNAPSWMKPTDVAGTAGYRENQGAVPDLLPKWAEAPLVQMNEQGEPLTPQGQAMAKQWTTFKAQHPSIAAVLDPVGAEGEWEKNSPNFAAAHEAFKEFTQSMTSPVQFGLMATGIFGQLGKLNDILGGIFAVQMAHGTYQSAKAAEEAYKKGDNPAAVKAATTAILNAAMLGSVAHHGLAGEEAPAAGAERETPVKAGKAAAPAPAQADPFAELGATFEEPTARTSPRASGNVPRGTSAPEALHPPIGQTEPETGRPVLQQSPRPEVNQAAATAEHPAVKDQLEAAVEPIKGAEVTGARDEKDEERLGEKMEAEGQSPRTVRDYSGFRIAVDSPEARDQTVAALRKQFEIPNESDEFEAGNDETGFHGHTLQVREPGSPVTHEVQVLPREVAENADERHNLYEKAREGDQNAAAEMKRLNQQDYQQFTDRQRGGRGTTPEQAAVEPKFKFGSTQANIPAGSEAAGALKTAREQIAPADRAGDVNDAKGGLVEQPHVTLRYGIQGGDTAGIRRFIESQAPFEASLGKTDSFPPSEHSDGAAAIVAPVEAPELHRIEKEIEGHGDFAARSFPQYKPHATLGYVKPEAAAKYTGMDETAGKKFLVRSIAITDRDGNVEEVPLRGQPAGMPALESSAGERARPWSADSVTRPEGTQARFEESQNSRPPAPGAATTRSMVPSESVNEGGTSTLVSIDKTSGKTIHQPAGDYREQMRRAREVAPQFQQMVDDISAVVGSRGTPVNLKSEAGVLDKMQRNGGRPPESVSDYIRARMPFDSVAETRRAARLIEQRYGAHDTEDFLEQPKNGGYRAVHMQVHLPNGQSAELQLVPREIYKIQEAAHLDYEVFRNPDATPEDKVQAYADLENRLNQAWEKQQREEGLHAVRERGAGEVRQRPPEEAGGAGDGRGRVEPGLEGREAAGAGTLFGGEEEAAAAAPEPTVKPAAEVRPNEVARVPVAELHADPKRFQYKMSTDAAGVTDLLKGRRWNDALAGVISVWRDPADGRVYVVNGHHRFELAQSSGGERMNVIALDAPDAATARSVGALQNIAEGRGTPMDAAKFFRDSGYTPEDLDRLGVSMKEKTAASGVALSRLADPIFDDVVTGRLRENRAVAIGNATADHGEQRSILNLIEKAERGGRRVTDDTVEELARMAKGAGTHTETQQTLFGAEEMTRNLALEKAEVSSYIRDQIGKETRLFGTVANEGAAGRLAAGGNRINASKNREIAGAASQAQELYDRLSTRAGDVDDILSRGAQALAKGENPSAVKQTAYEETRAALSQTLKQPTGGEPERVRAGRERPEEVPAAAAQRTGQSLKPPVPPSERAPAKAWQKGDRFLVRDPATGGWKAGEVTYWNEGVNGAKPGGRSRIGNAKLDEVPHDALPIKPVGGKIEPISGHPDEKETIARVEADEPAYLARYIENPANNKGGVLTIATDAAKEMFPEFKADPTGNDRNVAAAAGRINKGVLKTALSEPVDPKRPEVQIATASPGSGKTATNSAEANAKIGLKVEHIMDDARGSRKLLQNIIDSGRKPVVNWIYVDDIGATVDRMFRRAIGHDEKPGIGRTVQLNYMIDAYHQLPRVLREMKDEFGDKVVWIATDNSGPKGTARDADFDRTVDKAAEESYNQIRDTVHEKVNELRREGLFDSERGQAALRAAETTDRPDAQNPGSGRAGTGSGAGPEQTVPGQPGLRSPVLSSTKGPPGPVAETAAPSKGGGSLSPEEFKAGLDQARKGSLRDNAAAQQPKVIDTPEGGRHLPRAVVMDPDTYATWHRAGLGEKTAWRGLSLPRGLANKAEVVLRALAGSARSGTGGAEAAAGYDRLVEAIRKGRNDDGTVTLLRGDYRPDTVLEEAWHGWERANRAAESDAIRLIAERPEVKWAADRLREMGYGGKPGIEGRTEIALEMMAKTLSGDPDLRMTPEQRYDLAHEFLSTAVRESGPEVLKEIPGVTPEAEAALADARRSYEAEPNEGGRGRAARGAGPGANEGAAGRPGVEGRALLARGEGQPAPGGNEPGAQAGAAAGGELAPAKPKLGDVRTSQIEDSDEGKGWKEFYGSVYTERSPEELERMARGYGYPVSRNQRWAITGRMILSPEKDGSWAVRLAQVADRDRNLGVATEMYKRAIEYAKEQGATELTSDPEGGSKDNVAGIWRKLGAVETPGVGEKPGAVRWRLDLTKEQPAYQRAGKEVRPEDSFALPGMEGTDQARGAARGDAQAEELTERMKEPLGSIERAAGEMERNAPLFAGSEASGQGMLFGGTEEAAPGMLFQHQGKENPVARSVQDLIDALAKDPRNDDRTALQKVADWTGRTWDESTGRSAATLRETPNKLEQAWAKAKLLTAALVDGFRHPLQATDWKKSVGQMDLARAETAMKLRALAHEIKKAAPDPLARIGITHWIEAGGDPAKLDKWNQLAKARWEMRRGDPNASPRLKNHLEEAVSHYEAATRLTADQKALGMRVKQHLDDMLQLAKREGLLEYGARDYVRHLYEAADAADLVHLLDTNELDPNPGFIEKRIFQSYFEAENHGMIPRDKDVGYLVTAYDKAFNKALASRSMMKSLLDGRAPDGRPLAAIKLRGKWLVTDEQQRPLVLEQRERPKSIQGYEPLAHAPTRNFLFEPTMEDLDGYQYDPKMFEEEPARLAFKGDLIFHPSVADRIDDMFTPGWFDRNKNAAQKVGHAVLQGSAAAKELMTIMAPFHMVQLAEHSVDHWVNPLKLPEIDLSGKGEDSRIQRLLASNGLGLLDFDAEGLFSAKTLKGLAEGIPGLNVAMDGVNSLSRWQFEDVIPRMKMKMARVAFDRNWKSYGAKLEAEALDRVAGLDRRGSSRDKLREMAHEQAERMVAELTSKQANAAFGNLNTAFDSIHRSKTFKQLLRLTFFAPDFLESRIRYTGQAFTRYGGEQRAALARGALGMWLIARAANALLNKGDTKNDLDHAFTVVAGGRNFALRSQEGDILHLINDPRSFVYSRINPLTTRPFIEFVYGRDQMGRQKTGVHVLSDIAKATLPFSVQKVIQTPDEGWLNSIISSLGVTTSNYRSPAEEATHKLFIKSLPDLPDDPEKQAENRARYQLTEAVREGKKKPADVIEMAREGKFTVRQAFAIIERAGHSELYNEFSSGGVSIVPKHAGDPSALDIYAKATPAERMELRAALIRKGEDQLPELPRQAPADAADIRALEREWAEQEKTDPGFKRPDKIPDTRFDVLAARWRALLASTPHEQGVPAAPGQAAPPASAEASK